ncbi:MAG TPA: flippase-like domain-containing protein [Candidatus Latescibacteria bacterium]|nr:flippase-like domain-containing protein [Candidatus Latescibacterota bacterium]
MAVRLSRRGISKGLKLFVLLSILGFAFVFYVTGSRRTISAFGSFRLEYIWLLLLLVLGDYVLGTFRIYIFARRINSGGSFRNCFRANLANIFMAAVTPFQTGGGIAQIYILNRSGVSVSGALSVSIVNFIATLGILLAAVIFLIKSTSKEITGVPFKFVVSLSSFLFYFAFGLFLFFTIRPTVFTQVVARIGTWLRVVRRRGHTDGGRHELTRKLLELVDQYQRYMGYYWREAKGALILNLILTAVLYFNKCMVAYVVLLGMGVHAPVWRVVSVSLLIIFLLYFAPTPGASLVAETSASALMSVFVPSHMLMVFTFLWRSFGTYLGVALGGFILLKELASEVKG